MKMEITIRFEGDVVGKGGKISADAVGREKITATFLRDGNEVGKVRDVFGMPSMLMAGGIRDEGRNHDRHDHAEPGPELDDTQRRAIADAALFAAALLPDEVRFGPES